MVLILFCFSYVVAKAFPSSLVYFAIVGSWEDPTDIQTIEEFKQLYGSATAKEVARWELEHSDLYHLNPSHRNFIPFDEFKDKTKFYTYCYFHYFTNTSPPDGLKKIALKRGLNFEDFALHYREDTVINSTEICPN
ncbi:MAG: hypothetical protein JTT14_03030 [Candidatus Brockarchaeota archaeon]|nr:hypothetical protein [Candidatus Brockarchaeota archaeon]